jgi:desampylase
VANFRAKGKAASPSPLVRPRPADNSSFIAFAADGDGFCAYVHRSVLERIEGHARRGDPDEIIGLLAGRICQDLRRVPYTLVMAAEGATADEADGGPGHVHISPEGRASVSHRLIDSHPDREVVGWYHSHPRGPAHFSHTDASEQAGWTDPNQIGIVFAVRAPEEPLGVYRGPEADRLARLPAVPAERTPRNITVRGESSKPSRPNPRQEREAAGARGLPPPGASGLPLNLARESEPPSASSAVQRAVAGGGQRTGRPSVSRLFVMLAALGPLIALVWMNSRLSAVESAQRSAGGTTAVVAVPFPTAAPTTPPHEQPVLPVKADTGAAGLSPLTDAPVVPPAANPLKADKQKAAPAPVSRAERGDTAHARSAQSRGKKRNEAASSRKSKNSNEAATRQANEAQAKPAAKEPDSAGGTENKRPTNATPTPAANSRQRVAKPSPTP